MTVSEAEAARLVESSELEREGSGRPGFRYSEARYLLGMPGRVWRRYGPYQAASRYGTSYESWEWDGGQARLPARSLRGRDVQPSRTDVAFDFQCESWLTACRVVDRFRDAHKPGKTCRGVLIGASGDEPWLTRYVGSSDSDARLRIYRKDIQDPDFEGCPILRVEVVLRRKKARAWWRLWDQDEERALRAAAAHVEAMTGCRILPGDLELPDPECDDPTDEADSLFHFCEQHGSMLTALRDAGVSWDDIEKLARYTAGAGCRMTQYRRRRRVKAMKQMGVRALLDAVWRRLLATG